MAVVSRQDHFREPPQTLSSFSALCRLLCHDRTTSSVTSLSSSSCSSRSSAATIAHSHRDSSFFGVERPILGIHSSLCLAPSKPASPDSGFAVGIEVKRSSNDDFPLLQKKVHELLFFHKETHTFIMCRNILLIKHQTFPSYNLAQVNILNLQR